MDKKISKHILQDLDNVQYSVNDYLESKYSDNKSYDEKSNTNFVKIHPSHNLKTLLPHTQVTWAVPSSVTKLSEDSLKEIAKQRIIERFEIPDHQMYL